MFQVTGHKNVNSLNEYRSLSLNQQKEISHVLSGAFNKPQPAETMTSASVYDTSAQSENIDPDPFGDILDEDILSALDCVKSSTTNNPENNEVSNTHMQNCVFNGPVYLNVYKK